MYVCTFAVENNFSLEVTTPGRQFFQHIFKFLDQVQSIPGGNWVEDEVILYMVTNAQTLLDIGSDPDANGIFELETRASSQVSASERSSIPTYQEIHYFNYPF